MTRVLVFGGHGKVARLLAPVLTAGGQEVVSVIRNDDHRDAVASGGAVPLVLDLESASHDDLRTALEGIDAVVWSAGAGGGSAERTYAVDRDAAIRTMDAAAAAGVRRYLMVSWIGSRPDHGIDRDNSFFSYADAKLAADEHLRASALDWTILGPGGLTDDDAAGLITVEPAEGASVPRADVAGVIAAALADDRSIGRFIPFGSGDTPIAEAIAR